MATSLISICTRGSCSGFPASGPSGPRFHSTTSGTMSTTTTFAPGGSTSSVAKCEAHPQSADQQTRLFQLPCPSARQRRQRLLRAVHAARHKGLAIGENDVLVTAAHQLHDRAFTRNCLPEQL